MSFLASQTKQVPQAMPRLPDHYRDFVVPQDAGMYFTITALAELLKSSQAPNLLKYFGAIDVFIEETPNQHLPFLPEPSKVAKGKKHRYKNRKLSKRYDVCLPGFASRPNEITWQTELLRELLQANARVLCIAEINTPQWQSFEKCLAGNPTRSPQNGSSLIDIEEESVSAQEQGDMRAIRDWRLFHGILEPLGLHIKSTAYDLFSHVSLMSVIWEKLLSSVQIRSLVVRNNHAPENSAATIIAKNLGIRVFTFQHSVLSSMPSICPTFADIVYSHGQTSRSILEKFSIASCGFEPEYRSIGMWNQPDIHLVPDFASRRILLLDQECDWSKRYYGNAKSYSVLYEAVGEILRRQPTIRWRVRLHFDNDRRELWDKLALKFPGQLELSQAHSKTLTEDLKEVSLVTGLFSTAVCEAAKLGYPVIFINEPEWFYTPDLVDFDAVTMSLNEFSKQCPGILNDKALYDIIRNSSTNSASRYYFSRRKGLGTVVQDIINMAFDGGYSQARDF